MSIKIDSSKCIGCQNCIEVCPGSLIEKKDGKAFMKYPKDCWGCASCVKECPVGAVVYFLGADIGGRGNTMHVVREGDILHWSICKYDGTIQNIDVDRKNSNQY